MSLVVCGVASVAGVVCITCIGMVATGYVVIFRVVIVGVGRVAGITLVVSRVLSCRGRYE